MSKRGQQAENAKQPDTVAVQVRPSHHHLPISAPTLDAQNPVARGMGQSSSRQRNTEEALSPPFPLLPFIWKQTWVVEGETI